MKLLIGEAISTMLSAISSISANLFKGVLLRSSDRGESSACDMLFSKSGVATYPGQMALMRMPMSPYEQASAFVSPITPIIPVISHNHPI